MIRAAVIADQPATNNGKLVEAGRAEAEPGRFHHYCERNGQMPKSMARPSVQVVVSGLQNERSWQVVRRRDASSRNGDCLKQPLEFQSREDHAILHHCQ